jgi:hypothetical protein
VASATLLAVLLAVPFAVPFAGFDAAGASTPKPGDDPLEAELARWTSYLQTNPSAHEIWIDVKQMSEPVLARAHDALRDGRRLLALSRFAVVRGNLGAAAYLAGQSAAQLQDTTAFRAEWGRTGELLRADLAPVSPDTFDGVHPALVRSVAEAALPQVKVYYDASLDFERATDPAAGFFYLGLARAERDLAAFCRTLAPPSGGVETPPDGIAPTLRGLEPELDALEGEVLDAYRPPASIERHGEFILVGSSLKEARELNAMGLRHGALLRTLQAALRFGPLRGRSPMEAAALQEPLAAASARLATRDVDHTIGRLFLELAQAELASSRSDTASVMAVAAIVDVLPLYFAALDPPPSVSLKPAPRVTVTLVRWPYT